MRFMMRPKDKEEMRTIMRLRELRTTISFLGLDIIITPENKVVYVEINGANSGTKGFKKVYSRHIPKEVLEYLQRTRSLPILQFGASKGDAEIIALEEHSSFGKEDMYMVGPPDFFGFAKKAEPHIGNGQSAIVWNYHASHVFIDEKKYIVINPHAVSRAVHDKAIIHALFKGLEERPQAYTILFRNKEQDHSKDIASSKASHFVIKATDESQGRKIVVCPREELFDPRENPRQSPVAYFRQKEEAFTFWNEPNIIIEELIESKEIPSQTTGRNHYGCIRYIILVESEKGNITIKPFGGYWRLCAGDVHDEDLERRYIANLSNPNMKAIPEPLSEKDDETIKESITTIIPTLYKRFLRMPVNERPDRVEISDYCF